MQWMPMVLAAACGVNYGFQPADDGTMEYIIQIEPALLNELRNGQPITSVLPPEVQPIGRFRIVVGTEELPRQQQSLKPPISGAGPSTTSPNGSRFAQGPGRYGANRGGVADNGVGGNDFSAPDLMQPPAGNDTEWPPAGDDTAWPPAGDPPKGNFRGNGSGLTAPGKNRPPVRVAANDLDRGAGFRNKQSSSELSRAPDPLGLGGETLPESSTDNKNGNSRTGSDERPWTMFLMTLVALFGSLGANLYLGWVLWDTHRRYFDVLDELQSTRGAK